MGTFLHTATLWKLEGPCTPCTLKDNFNAACLSLSVWELCKGNLKGELLYWGYVKKGSGTVISLQQGPRWVTMEGGSFTRDFFSKV